MTIFSRNFGGAWPLWPPLATPVLWSPSEIFCVRHWVQPLFNSICRHQWPLRLLYCDLNDAIPEAWLMGQIIWTDSK